MLRPCRRRAGDLQRAQLFSGQARRASIELVDRSRKQRAKVGERLPYPKKCQWRRILLPSKQGVWLRKRCVLSTMARTCPSAGPSEAERKPSTAGIVKSTFMTLIIPSSQAVLFLVVTTLQGHRAFRSSRLAEINEVGLRTEHVRPRRQLRDALGLRVPILQAFNASQPGVLDPNVPRPAQGFAGRHAASARHDITAQKITAIISNVDLYEVPGGNRRIIGMLRQGQTFSLIECRKDNWCKLSNGWVRGSYVVRNQSQ